ncbi:dispanin subfamily A member 2b-like [Pelobates fuscus]|uniref:dispanin subfamily A member 2b-like n=1 Tax=Pelobates fuscus TaxID=191477 RepID=UPI002FE4BA71
MRTDEESMTLNTCFSNCPSHGSLDYRTLKENDEVTSEQTPASKETKSSADTPIRDHLMWSIFNTLYLNTFCLGLVAVLFSVKSRDRKIAGDLKGAIRYGSIARSINIIATVFSFIIITIAIILVIKLVLSLQYAHVE